MAKFENIEELLSELNRHKSLFTALFEKRMITIDEDTVLGFIDDDAERLNRLENYGLLDRGKGSVSLDGRLQEFFEEFLEVDETIHVLYIQENLDKIKEYQSYFLKETRPKAKEEYLVKVKKHLRRINRTTRLNVKTLRRNLEDTYMLESDFEMKREKLNNLRTQRDGLEGVLKAVDRLLRDDLFFKTASDEELLSIAHVLRMTIRETYHNLAEVQQKIILYLNQIQFREEVVDKILHLKSLKDKHLLKERSNFFDLAKEESGLPIKKVEQQKTLLSLDQLIEEEEMHRLILKVRKREKEQRLQSQNAAGTIDPTDLESQATIENTINLQALKNNFLGKQLDLFAFLMQHKFTSEVDSQTRIRLYCRLASLYELEFDFSDEVGNYQHLEYAIIYPKNTVRL